MIVNHYIRKGFHEEDSVDFHIITCNSNPFNPTTVIPYELATDSEIQITVYDINGKNVMDVFHGLQTQGYHQLILNASDLSSGIYILTMKVGKKMLARKLTLLK